MEIVIFVVCISVDVAQRPKYEMDHKDDSRKRSIAIESLIEVVMLVPSHPTVGQHEYQERHHDLSYHFKYCAKNVANYQAISVLFVKGVVGEAAADGNKLDSE